MDQSKSNQNQEPSVLSKTIKVLAFPFAGIAGYWFGQASIRGSAYDNVKNHAAINDLRDPVLDKMRVIGRDAAQRAAKGETVDLYAATKELHAGYDRLAETRLQKLGLGTLDKQWKFTLKYQKQQALMNAFTAATLTLGSMLALAHSKTLANVFSHHPEKDQDPQGPSL